jgi:hypothetical protein
MIESNMALSASEGGRAAKVAWIMAFDRQRSTLAFVTRDIPDDRTISTWRRGGRRRWTTLWTRSLARRRSSGQSHPSATVLKNQARKTS